MKYWLYSDGNILGPYSPDELMGLPAFSSGSLVCPENSTGDNADDWRPAEAIGEIAEALSVGVGQIMSSDKFYVSDIYSLETGFSGRETQKIYEAKNDEKSSGDLIEAVDDILGEYNGDSKKNADKNDEADYSLLDKFDIRLAKIKEELEAARWEKNLLLEKMKIKETEEKKNYDEIEGLKKQLREAIDAIKEKYPPEPTNVVEAERADEKIVEDLEKIKISREDSLKADEYDRLRKEEESINAEFAGDAPQKKMTEPDIQIPSETKSVHISKRVSDHVLEAKELSDKHEEVAGTEHISSNTLKRFSHVKSEKIFDDNAGANEEIKTAPGERLGEKASEDETISKKESEEILNIQPAGMVYDFTAVTPKQPSVRKESVNITIEETKSAGDKSEPKVESVKPVLNAPSFVDKSSQKNEFSFKPDKVASAPDLSANLPKEAAPSPAAIVSSSEKPAAKVESPKEGLKPAEKPIVKKEARVGDKTERILINPLKKDKAAVNGKPEKTKLRKSSMVFLIVVVVFGAIVAGGLGFFFFSDGLSLSEFSLMGTASKKKVSAPGLPVSAKKTRPSNVSRPISARPSPAKAVVPSANENIRKAINIAKNHKLMGGRGSVSSWLSTSFLAGSSTKLNEEWSATILHKNIFVAQYRLLRQRKEPVVYQFEVDVAKGAITRGINNNAMELLDFPAKRKALKKKIVKPVKKPVSSKPSKTKKTQKKKLRELPQLKLPNEPLNNSEYKEPSGFENITLSANDRVKYIMAQESDEDLF